jgi:hypothetical protein
VIGVVAIKEPAIVVLDNVAEALWVGPRQIRIERLDPVDAQIGPVLQFVDVVIAGKVPSLRLFRPMHRLSFAHLPVIGVRVLHRRRREQSVAVELRRLLRSRVAPGPLANLEQ